MTRAATTTFSAAGVHGGAHANRSAAAYVAAACLALVTFVAVAALLDPAGTRASSRFLPSYASSSSPASPASSSSLQRGSGGGGVAGELLLATSASYSSSSGAGDRRNSTGKEVHQEGLRLRRGNSGGREDDGLLSSSQPRLVNYSSSAAGHDGAPQEVAVAPGADADAQAPVPLPELTKETDASRVIPQMQRRTRDVKLERLERGLARARSAIMEAMQNKDKRPPLPDPDYVPVGPIYRNAYAFHRSYLEMEKLFKVYVYEEGEPPVFHDGPCRSIYSTEGRFIHYLETMPASGAGGMRTRDPARAHAFFLPFSVVKMVKTIYEPGSHDMSPLRRAVADYVDVVAARHPFWNRSLGADHFMLSCHDWGPYVSSAHAQLRHNAIRVLCNANVSEGFDPARDVSLPEVNLRTDAVERQVGGPSASRRPLLAFFAGGNHGPVRPALLRHWRGRDPDVAVSSYLPRGRGKPTYTDMVRRARFCLCPGGYEVASPRLAEAIYLECVPVVVDDGDYALPFADVLDWDAFSLRVRVADIPRIKDILSAVSPRRYIQLQRRVRMVRRHFMVHGGPPRRYDAFHMTLHSVWLRRLNVRIDN